jgi:hypothetical protein
MHWNALCDPQILTDAKTHVRRNVHVVLFVKSVSVPPEHEKWYVDILRHRSSGMHYVTCGSHRMQKHKFSVMCLGALFLIRMSPT